MEKENRCSECGALFSHAPLCSKIELEDAKSLLKTYYELWLTKGDGSYFKIWRLAIKRIEMMKKEITMWRGKFNDVRHENNKLRKAKYPNNKNKRSY